MAKAKKLPSGSWRVQAAITVDKKIYRKSFTAPTKREAEMKAIEWQGSAVVIPSEVTLRQACERYILKRSNVISPVTAKTYQGYMHRYLTEYMNYPISKLAKINLQAIFNEMAGNLSPKTLKNVYGFFKAALGENNIAVNIKLPKVQKKIYSVPGPKTAKQILEAVKGTDIEVPVNLALRCGLRMSEVCGLKWSKVYEKYIVIDSVYVKFGDEYIEKPPKSVAGNRKVPITKDIYDMIMALPKDGERIYTKTPDHIRKQLHRILKDNELPDMRYHDLRHGFASAMAANGVPERYAMSIGGWDTPKVLHEIYEQTFSEIEEEYVKRIDNYFTR